MSSNIEVKRICQHCRKEFIARTTVTKYCSHKCSSRAYKARTRAKKVEQSNTETMGIRQQPIETLKAKEFLGINDVSKLIGISRRTVYRLIERGELSKVKIGSRSIIRRSALNLFIDEAETKTSIQTERPKKGGTDWNDPKTFDINECYTLTEIEHKYNISESSVQSLVKRNNIPKFRKGRYAYVPKIFIDELLR